MKRVFVLLTVCLLLAACLAGCGGEALPEGVEEEALLAAGREVVLQIVEGDYQGVHQAFRQDVRESTSAEAVRDLALSGMGGAGVYKQIDSSMTTGQTVGGEQIGVAVFYCEFSEDDVLFRVSFDGELSLVGLSIQKQ